jgi:hypothetical protein
LCGESVFVAEPVDSRVEFEELVLQVVGWERAPVDGARDLAELESEIPCDIFVLLADSLRPEHDVIDTMDILVQASTSFTSAVEGGIVLADAGGVLAGGPGSPS